MTEPGLGQNEIQVRVAGVTFRAAAPDRDGPVLVLPPASRGFVPAAPGRIDIDLSVRWGDLPSSSPGTPVFDSGGTWRLYREGPLEVFRFWAEDRSSNPFLECRLHPERWTGDVILNRDHYDPAVPVPALQYPLDELLMVHFLGRGWGVELHACGVVTADGLGYLFTGQSGHGKSTTARIWEAIPGTRILSDDRIVVRREAGEFVMYGTPWHGEAQLAVDGRSPVHAVFVLEHGKQNALAPLTPSEGAALLGARSFVPFHDAGALEWSLGFLDEFVRTVPCKRLAFVPDESARTFVEERCGSSRRNSSSDLLEHEDATPERRWLASSVQTDTRFSASEPQSTDTLLK